MDILLEQLVYGSFPFWDRGYDVLARSPGCRADWVADVLSACRKFGEAPTGVTPCPALFAAPARERPLGHRGRRAARGRRPGSPRGPGVPRACWSRLATTARPARTPSRSPRPCAATGRAGPHLRRSLDGRNAPFEPSDRPSNPRIAQALAAGRKVELKSLEPIDALAREVWSSLPESTRRRSSVSTWAFGNANEFSLVALARAPGVEFDDPDLDLALPRKWGLAPGVLARCLSPFPRRLGPRHLPYYYGVLAAVGLAVIVAVTLTWRARPDSPRSTTAPSTNPDLPDSPVGPEVRARIVAGLEALADRFEVGGSNDPGELMARLSKQVRYRGPTLSTLQLARLAEESDPDRDRALGWHDRLIKTFVDDRPLPGDFDRLPLDRQLDRLAWSFHLEPSTPTEAIPGALLERLFATARSARLRWPPATRL